MGLEKFLGPLSFEEISHTCYSEFMLPANFLPSMYSQIIEMLLYFLYLYMISVTSLKSPIDIDECTEINLHNCSMNALCFNQKGSYFCRCMHGYSGTGTKCSGYKLFDSLVSIRQLFHKNTIEDNVMLINRIML